jgi:hypothetical protein
MGNQPSSDNESDLDPDDQPQCLVSNYFTDESSEEDIEWNPCCPEGERINHVKSIDDLVTYMRGIFVTREIQDVMKTVMRCVFIQQFE